MSASIRKNFLFDERVVKQLETLSQVRQQSQTAIIQELIRESAKGIEREKRLEALHSLAGSMNGLLGTQTIQSIKSHQDV